jgi:hypothetical protein
MTGRHRRWEAPGPGSAALGSAVQTAVDAALAVTDRDAAFEDKVVDVFSDVVWQLRTDAGPAVMRFAPEDGPPPLTLASGAALPAVTDFTAKRLESLAMESGVQLDDSESLADVLVRLAHAVLLVPDPERALTSRPELDDYARRHLTPVLTYAVDASPVPVGSVAGQHPRRNRRFRVDMVAATLLAMLIGCAGLFTAMSRFDPPSVTPTNMTGSVPLPPAAPPKEPVVELPAPVLPSVAPRPSPTAAQEPVSSPTPFPTPEPVDAAPPTVDARGSDGPVGDDDEPGDMGGLPPILVGPMPPRSFPGVFPGVPSRQPTGRPPVPFGPSSGPSRGPGLGSPPGRPSLSGGPDRNDGPS